MTCRLVLFRATLALAGAALAGACASSGGVVPRPFPAPGSAGSARVQRPQPAPPPDLKAVDGDALVGTALSLRGVPYRDGGADPNGFDCSGFTQYVYAQHAVALPRGVRDQFQLGKSVKPENVTAGDLLFFATVATSTTSTTSIPGPTHVGIAIGSGQFVHAPSSTGVVRVERVSSSYWSTRYLGARRVQSTINN